MFRTLGALVKWAVLLPILLAVVLLAVANDQDVTVRLNLFDPGDPVLSYALPLYQLAFLVFVVGVLFGGVIAWSGSRRRRRVRDEAVAPRPLQSARGDRHVPEPPASSASAFLPRP